MYKLDSINLVGGLELEFYGFSYIGNFIIPTDFHIFQRVSNHQPETIPSFKWFMIVLPTLMRADSDTERSSRAWGFETQRWWIQASNGG